MADLIESSVDSQPALLSALLDQTHDCIELLDGEGRILFVNRESLRTMELSAPVAVVGQRWIDRWPADRRADLEDALGTARAGTAVRFTAPRRGPDDETRWWDVTLAPIATAGAAAFLTVARDITAETTERERAAAIGAEMRHRLRNAMTIAAGIVTMAARSQPEHRLFARAVAERFAQLGRVQDLLLDPARENRLPDIVPLLAKAYGDEALLRFGTVPDVRLAQGPMQALALAFGELATNSLKYGALKHGKPVGIDGVTENNMLRLIWREPTRLGASRDGSQGLGLIDRLIAVSGGTVDYADDNGDLVVRIALPCF